MSSPGSELNEKAKIMLLALFLQNNSVGAPVE